MKRLITVVALAVTVMGGAASFAAPASAAPITCPSGQTATGTKGTFTCENKGGQDTGAVRPKGGNKNFSGPPN